ncbi:MAG: YdcF family protein [Clostridia bacterium]|nr:YdcF family protein [Clostridia bacterium]
MNALGIVYLLAGGACMAYYFLIGFYSRFGLSIQRIWLAAGAALIAAGLLTRAPVPRWLRYAWRALLVAGLLLLAGLEGLVISGMSATAPPGMKYLMVLGANVYADGPSPALTRRIDAVMGCLDQHPDADIIATGGQGKDEPVAESRCIRDELVNRGVAPSRILMEGKSTNTWENMTFSRALIDGEDAAVGIVTNNFHIWRSLRLARRAGLTNVHGIAAEYTGPTLVHFMVREAISIAVWFLRGRL